MNMLVVGVLMAVFLCQKAIAKPVVSYDFESAEQIDAFRASAGKGSEIIPTNVPVHSGQQAVIIRPTPQGQQSAEVPLPKDFDKGCVTFWFYDNIAAGMATGASARSGWALDGSWTVNGKTSARPIAGCDTGREHPNWVTEHFNDTRSDTGVRRHDGWTKFDIVLEPEAPGRSAIVYIDGREAFRRPAEGFKPTVLRFATFWGAGDFAIDDIVIDNDPASFRPAVAQSISAGDEANNITLLPGQKLALDIGLDARGASSKKGILEVELLDLQEKSVCRQNAEIDWSAVKDSRIAVSLPPPPASKHYWVIASYRDEGDKEPSSRTIGRINVRYLTDAAARSFRGQREFANLWDWLPAAKDAMDAPPAKWDGAEKVRNLWNFNMNSRHKDVTAGWYHRSIEVPGDWSGRRILLRVEQPQRAAKIFLGGALAGTLIWPGGELDITGKVKPGAKVELTMLVDSEAGTVLTKALTSALGKGTVLPEQFRSSAARGLGGEVSLLSEPMGARIDGVTIDTSVATMTLKLGFSVEGLAADAAYVIEGTVSKGGRAVKSFTSAPFKTPGKDPVRIELPFPEAELWDIGKPNLYDLNAKLILRGKAVDAILPERFGFREVAFDGRLVKINGNPVNLFTPMVPTLMGNLGFAKSMELNNLNYLSSMHKFFYADGGSQSSVMADDNFNFADEAGIGTDIGIPNIFYRSYLVNLCYSKGGSFLEDPVYWPAFEQVVKRAVKRYGNSPGLFFFLGAGEGGQLGMGGVFNPLKMDGLWQKRYEDRPVNRHARDVELKAQDLTRRIDPRRRIIGQDAGNFADAIHITNYTGFENMQELIESNEYWRKNGVKPYMITEQAAPMFPDWTTQRRQGHNAPFPVWGVVAEWAAVTMGDAAYHRQPVDQEVLDNFSKVNIPHQSGYIYAYGRTPGTPSAFRRINNERCREQWLNWRADGIGLVEKWGFLAGDEDALKAACAPLTGFIAGNAARRTDKTHILRPGETWERQFLVLNNRRESAKIACEWTVTLNGEKLDSGSAKAELLPGGQATIPIKAAIPDVKADASGILSVKLVEDGKELAADKMDFQVLVPVKAPAISGRVALIDPEGASAEALDSIGVRYQRLPINADLAAYDIVIFGRKAFSYETALSKPIDLGALMAAGKKILILEQEESVLKGRFNFRTEYVSPRSMFGRVAGHPVTAGLPDGALNFWRGAATLTDGYEDARRQSMESEANGHLQFIVWHDGKEHPRPMKWGNNHNVATVVINKPDRGNFRTLVDCEFGLDYAAVMELEQGPGRMLFCQADVSGRSAAEPAAERLLANMVGYLGGARPVNWSSGAAYLGGEKGADLLERLQVSFRKVNSPDEVKPGETLVLGDGLTPETLASVKPSISRFVENGGTCLSLPRGKEEWAWLPFDVSAKDSLVDATIIDKPARPLLAGLSNSELFYPARIPLVTLDKIPAEGFRLDPGVIAEVPRGKGRYIFCQVAPDSFDTAAKPNLADAKKRSYRVFQALLNNLGAPMAPPRFLAPAADSPTVAKRPPLDLATATWAGLKTEAGDSSTPSPSDPRWKPVTVPGYVDEQRPDWKNSAVFWYRCRFTIDKLPALSAASNLHIGAIKDEDDISLNGTPVGHTGRDNHVNDWLTAPRFYPVPAKLLREGENELLIRIVNLGGACGISAGPARMIWGADEKPKTEVSLMDLASRPPLDLVGQWLVLLADAGEAVQPADTDPRWKSKYVPGPVIDLENRSVWCRRDINIKEIPAGARPVLVIGAVDDEDETYINGQKVGHIGKDTNPKNYYTAQRAYAIPAGLLKVGANRIVVKVNNLPPGPGSIVAPIQICWMPPDEASKLRLSASPYIFEVGRLDDPYWNRGW
ncbi:MAG: hypothetical protein WCS31_07870 [Verrucomicrobiae bacterium]